MTLTPRAEARLQALAKRRGQAPEAVIEIALDALLQQEEAAPSQPSGVDKAEQARMRQAMDQMLAKARALKPEPRADDPNRPPEEVAFGEIVVEKFRLQGFNL